MKPGRLTDGDGTGLVTTDPASSQREIAREDVAATLAACLEIPSTVGKEFALLAGPTPIRDALARL